MLGGAPDTPSRLLARAVHESRWCFYDQRRGRLIVWDGDPMLRVIDADTGVESDTPWPVGPDALDGGGGVAALRAVIDERIASGY